MGLLFVAGLLVLETVPTMHHCRRFVREFIPTANKATVAPALGKGAGTIG